METTPKKKKRREKRVSVELVEPRKGLNKAKIRNRRQDLRDISLCYLRCPASISSHIFCYNIIGLIILKLQHWPTISIVNLALIPGLTELGVFICYSI
jgi:hypothetical protein